MTPLVDPESAHLAALHRLGDFHGQRVLEFGCGEGRLTVPIARDASHVLALDRDAEAVLRARRSLPTDLAGRVAYHVASGRSRDIEPHSFDLTVFSWSLWCVDSEDVVDVLSNMVAAVKPSGLVFDLQVIRPNPVVETNGRVVCEIDGAPLFRTADAAVAAIDALVQTGRLVEEAIDDHDVLKHYSDGTAVLTDFVGSKRRIADEAVPELEQLSDPCRLRERCRLRRLRVR